MIVENKRTVPVFPVFVPVFRVHLTIQFIKERIINVYYYHSKP